MRIRTFKYSDFEIITQLAMKAFANEYEASGMSRESLKQQIGWIVFGRMLPFRALTAISGIDWQIFVAEQDGQIVGCASYMGRGKSRELANLMVDPAYRRQGIGSALLTARLDALRELGVEYVTTTILADNHASIGNVRKQGFEPFDSYHLYESALPYQGGETGELVARPITSADKNQMLSIEQASATPNWLRIQKTATDNYHGTFLQKLMDRFYGTQRVALAFEHKNETVGYLLGITQKGQKAITVARPIVSDDMIQFVAKMLSVILNHFDQQDKSIVRISIPSHRQDLVETFEGSDQWGNVQSWQRLVKWLN